MPQNQLVTGNGKAKNMSETENDNWQLGRHTPVAVVDQLATELVQQFENDEYYKWYCASIYDLGVDRIQEIRGRISDARNPARLFSHYVNQDRKALKNRWLIRQQKKKFKND